MNAADILNQAVACHQEGRLIDAERLYQSILQVEPANVDALHNMGLLQIQCSNPVAALPWFKAALEAQPENPQCWQSYAGALLEAGVPDQARQVLLSGRSAGLEGPEVDLLEARVTAAWARQPDIASLQALAEMGQFEGLAEQATEQLARFGDDITLLGLLAEALLHLQRPAEALPCLERACAAVSGADDVWLLYGLALRRLGRVEEAYGAYLKVWVQRPNDAYVRASLGRNLLDGGYLEEACVWLALGFEKAPDDESLRDDLTNALSRLGYQEQAQAVQEWREDVAGVFDTPSVMLAALGLGRTTSGSPPRRKKRIVAGPGATERNRAMALFSGGHNADLAQFAWELVERYPLDAFGWKALGVVMALEARIDRAFIARLLCVAAAPDDVEALCNLATLLKDLGRQEDVEIEACVARAISIDPDCAAAYRLMGGTLARRNRLTESDAAFQKALELKPELHEVRSALLFAMSRSETGTHAQRLEKACEFGHRVQVRPTKRFDSWGGEAHPQRLRVGMVSGDLRVHPVGHFLENVLAHLDPARLELFTYSSTDEADALTERIRPRFASWKGVKGMSDEAAARLIHDDGVHVLLDLAGHTSDNRLPVFAYKPAPVQASWLGYFATTGVRQMDYVLADPFVAPFEDGGHFVEQFWRLPESYLCFTPPEYSIEPGDLPALGNGFVTFGCFNNLSKMNDAVVAQRARVLQAVPDSRLLLKTKLLDNPAVRQATYDRFAAHGIDPARLILEGHAPRAELLAAYKRVDIALDPFPYPGGTTSVEALWMAVPVLTKRGDSFLSRMGVSICSNAGLPDWIAEDEDDYVDRAAAFAQDLSSLARLRGGLRAQVLASPLFDAPRFARHFEDAMWGMWRGWAEKKGK
ncbi:MAG: tetratricopeptide repeat protein [Azoarcus sp.]|nr:tetratricopeptide repeat protein [Azoarcus sp.]